MRFTTLLIVLIIAGVLLLGASWGMASNTVSDLLGAPAPQMGTSHTKLDYQGAKAIKGHPRAWEFSYGPTAIPDAPSVRIYVDLAGHLLRTEPANLAEQLKIFHAKGF